MNKPTEHKTVQARILAYAEAIGWTMVSREAAERRRGFDPEVPPADRARNRSLFFDDLLDAKVREFPVRRGLNRRERRDHKEELAGSIWPQSAAISSCRQFGDRLFQKFASACRQILEQAVQEMNRAHEIP